MTRRVLEFNDAGLRLSDDSGVLLSSPGYALVTPKRIEFGESARGQSRLNPLHCFNQFWHKLSLDPFARPIGHFRHNADIAFSHLQDLAKTAELEGDVLLAVPGSFSRQQLAILLGLLKQSPLRAVGVVDAGLAAVMEQVDQDSVIHADLQLHQVVLSRLQRQGDEILRESVALVPGTGWVNLSDSLLQLFTTAFIQQCRFNPQHNAESEQKLLDGLPAWLLEDGELDEAGATGAESEDSRRSLLIRLEHNNTVHQARLSRSSVHHRLQPFFQKIMQQIAALDPDSTSTLLISERLQSLPGFLDHLRAHPGVRTLGSHDESAIGRVCRRYSDALVSAPDAVNFITRLRVAGRPAAIAGASAGTHAPLPTHLLAGHQARRLRDGLQIFRVTSPDGGGSLQLSRRESNAGVSLGEITREDGHFAIHKVDGLQINGVPVHGAHRLALGDRIGAAGSASTIDVIRVQDSDE